MLLGVSMLAGILMFCYGGFGILASEPSGKTYLLLGILFTAGSMVIERKVLGKPKPTGKGYILTSLANLGMLAAVVLLVVGVLIFLFPQGVPITVGCVMVVGSLALFALSYYLNKKTKPTESISESPVPEEVTIGE